MYSLVGKGLILLSPQDSIVTVDRTKSFLARKLHRAPVRSAWHLVFCRDSHGDYRTAAGSQSVISSSPASFQPDRTKRQQIVVMTDLRRCVSLVGVTRPCGCYGYFTHNDGDGRFSCQPVQPFLDSKSSFNASHSLYVVDVESYYKERFLFAKTSNIVLTAKRQNSTDEEAIDSRLSPLDSRLSLNISPDL
jgi:hypothetical protein